MAFTATAEGLDDEIAIRLTPLSHGARPGRGQGGADRESVDTSSEVAGFGFDSPGRPRPRIAIAAAQR
jgi:hypothetical protein